MLATTKFVNQYWPNMYVAKETGEILRVFTQGGCTCRQNAIDTLKTWEEFYTSPKYSPIISWVDVYKGAKCVRLICKKEYHYGRPVMNDLIR